jgi:hypothetical protein
VFGWLTRLFRQRVEAEAAPAAAPPPPDAPPLATPAPTDRRSAIEATDQAEPADQAVEEPALLEIAPAASEADAKETCPTCGRTSVFAGPPGQRFCTYCALRDELFEPSAAATE